MRATVLVLLVVGASAFGAVPAGATGVLDTAAATNGADAPDATDDTDGDAPNVAESTAEASVMADRAPPELPERWRRTYGGDGDDMFADLVRTDDGGYLIVGWKGDKNLDGWVVKVDGEGQKQWERTFGADGTDRFWGVAKTAAGYLLAGRTDRESGPNGWILRLGERGAKRSERTPGTGAFYAVERADSGYLFAGWTRGESGVAGWATKLAADGTEQWSKVYPAPDGYAKSYLRAVVPAGDGYYLAGKVEGDSDDMLAMKVDAAGTPRWSATAGGDARDDVWAAAPADSGVVVVGETESGSDGPRDGWLVKFGADGAVQWERTPGGNGTDWLDSAMRTDDGYLFTGSSTAGGFGGADGYVLATDADGETRWESYYGTAGWDKPWPHVRGHGGGHVLAGASSGDGAAGKDGWLLRIGGGSGSEATSAPTTNGSTTGTENRTTMNATESDATSGALDAGTETATDADGSAGDVPGFGAVAALLALASAAAALARRS